MSTCAFITKSVFDTAPPRQSRRPPLEEKLLARLMNEAAKIHDDLQQLDAADHDEISEQIDTATGVLIEIRAALLKAMGRNP